MLLSDRDIKQEMSTGRIGLEPSDAAMIQPSSVDVRLDRYFRLFDNHKYPFIDPAIDQPELTRLVEAKNGEPFILHPGEFVLGSTYEAVTLPDDLGVWIDVEDLDLSIGGLYRIRRRVCFKIDIELGVRLMVVNHEHSLASGACVDSAQCSGSVRPVRRPETGP